MRYVIYLLLVAIAATLILVYVKISSVKPEPVRVEEKIVKKVEKEEIKKPLFFNLPVRILFMKIDLKKLKKVIIYRLTLDVNDRFGLFNVKVLLDNNNVAYSLFEDRKVVKVYVLFKSLKEAERILKIFREYNFKIKIEKLIKRI